MEKHFVKLAGSEALEELLNRSKEGPVVIFKHSTTCSVSAAAYDEMEQFDGEVALIEVQRARDLSREIEKKTGIPHETPQVIVIEKGKVVWNASHWKVTAQAVADAVQRTGK